MCLYAAVSVYAAMLVTVTESVSLGSGSALRIHVHVAVVAEVIFSSPWPYSAWRKADVEGCGEIHFVSGEGRGKGSGSRQAAPPEDSRYSNSTSLLLHLHRPSRLPPSPIVM